MPSKTQKYRGSRTHGRGRKAGRGSGKRGGTGNAGLGSHRKLSLIKNPDSYRRRGSSFRKGFHRTIEEIKTINLSDLGKFSQNVLNLQDFGYEKLLGRGSIDRALNISVKLCSAKAREKIEAFGGSVTIISND